MHLNAIYNDRLSEAAF